ncbi:MAG: SAM-dependent methyltransferase [Burkholderiaceae bacterium]
MPASEQSSSVSAPLQALIEQEIAAAGGWLPFDRFMALALYAPGLGYYMQGKPVFGAWPGSGSDFVTAPELSPLFGQCLAVQVRQALQACEARTIFEFGAGSGALAESLLDALDDAAIDYAIVDLSGSLRQRQQQRLARFGSRVQWLDRWPEAMHGVVIGNEVLDAMPVQLLAWDGQRWHERGVEAHDGHLAWADRATARRPPVEDGFAPGTVVEIHRQAEAFIASLAQHLNRGVAFFVDYGFPEAEYYHPQRSAGTLMCHRAHRADTDPLDDVGEKDITAHVNFTGIALAAQEAGLEVLGYTSQGRFLLNLGLAERMQAADVRARAAAHRLVDEHEMGELFKVIALARGCVFEPVGFASGDRTHRL